jgi:hypothetical protein
MDAVMKAKKGRKHMAIEIEIAVEAGSIVCRPNAGNLRAPAGTEIVWRTKDSKREFNLEFFTLTVGKDDSPFKSKQCDACVTAGQPFTAILKGWEGDGDLGMYEYNITTGKSLVLDPVIVMDRQ